MRKIVRLLLAAVSAMLFGTFTAAAEQPQDEFSRFCERMSSERVEFNFSLRLEGEAMPLFFSGSASLELRAYHFTYNSMEVWSDSKTRWVVDNDSKAVYIEAEAEEFSFDNPAALLGSIDRYFTVSGKPSGDCYTLLPAKSIEKQVEKVEITFSKGDPSIVTVYARGGSRVKVSLSDVVYLPLQGSDSYICSPEKGYEITDLR